MSFSRVSPRAALLVLILVLFVPKSYVHAADVPPTIVSGKILTPYVYVANQKANITLSFVVSAPGQYMNAAFSLISPSGRAYFLESESVRPGATAGTFRAGTSSALLFGEGPEGTAPVGTVIAITEPWSDLEPGTYTLTAGSITDYSGNSTSYGQSQLATLFGGGTLTVVNSGQSDNAYPDLVSGTILTPTVNLSAPHHYLAMRLAATDDVSGFSSIEMVAVYNGRPPAGYTSAILVDGGAVVPFTKGNVIAFQTDFSKVAPGTYTVFSINTICDAASNCLDSEDMSDLASLFGGKPSFQVTK